MIGYITQPPPQKTSPTRTNQTNPKTKQTPNVPCVFPAYPPPPPSSPNEDYWFVHHQSFSNKKSKQIHSNQKFLLFEQWYMVSVVHIYNRWRTSEMRSYVNGELVSSGEMQWHVGANEVRQTNVTTDVTNLVTAPHTYSWTTLCYSQSCETSAEIRVFEFFPFRVFLAGRWPKIRTRKNNFLVFFSMTRSHACIHHLSRSYDWTNGVCMLDSNCLWLPGNHCGLVGKTSALGCRFESHLTQCLSNMPMIFLCLHTHGCKGKTTNNIGVWVPFLVVTLEQLNPGV